MADRSLLRNRNMPNGGARTARVVHRKDCREHRLSEFGKWNKQALFAAHRCFPPAQMAWIPITVHQAENLPRQAYRCPECGQNFVAYAPSVQHSGQNVSVADRPRRHL